MICSRRGFPVRLSPVDACKLTGRPWLFELPLNSEPPDSVAGSNVVVELEGDALLTCEAEDRRLVCTPEASTKPSVVPLV
jgi:hypothetical protein